MALLESVFVATVHHVGRQSSVPVGGSATEQAPQNVVPVSDGWAQLDAVDFHKELLTRVPMLKSCSHWLRGRFREGLSVALRERYRAKLANDELGQITAWKLFFLVPKMMLHRRRNTGSVGRDELARRVTEIQQGHREQLIREANEFRFQFIPVQTRTPEEEVTRRALAVQSRVQRGQVSRVQQELIRAALAPRNAATLEALQERRLQEPTSAIPREAMDFEPTSPLLLDSKAFAKCLREAPSGCAPGPGGCTNDDHELLQLLFSASEDFARGTVPPTVRRVLMVATMTALQKPDGREEGGVRGIAAGMSVRGVDVVGVVTPLRGGAQVVLHGDQVVELSVLLGVHEKREVEEDGEGQVEVEREEGEVKEKRTWMTMRMG